MQGFNVWLPASHVVTFSPLPGAVITLAMYKSCYRSSGIQREFVVLSSYWHLPSLLYVVTWTLLYLHLAECQLILTPYVV